MDNFLSEIFKNDPIIKQERLYGGMMNESSLLTTKTGKQYILYMPTKQANEMVDRNLEKECQSLSFSLGITSKNIYFDVEKGIKINEFIQGESLNRLNNKDIDVNKVAALLKNLHSSKEKAKKDYLPFERLMAFEKEKESLGIKDEKEYSSLRELVFSHRSYLENGPLVLSHNDFQKSNIVKSVNGEYFIIDFEFMMNNYEIYDIACYGNNDVKDGYELLKAYFKDSLTDEHKKQYYLWRTFVSLQWYNVALIKDKRGEGKTHNMDFHEVALYFLKNALEASSNLSI